MLELAALTQTKYITIMDGVIGWLLQSVALVKLCIFNKPNIGYIREFPIAWLFLIEVVLQCYLLMVTV